jgi:predicted glutamine amidotransferase
MASSWAEEGGNLMCGLVGVYSSFMIGKHKEVISNLLYLDTWRGPDATGVAAIRQNGDTVVMKSTIPGFEFIQGPRLGEHLRINDFCWIGHNRFGTVGRNVKSNAHPFMILDEDGSCTLVGAHNGTLKNKHTLRDANTFGTDSEALFNNIAETSLKDTLALVEGAWALTYYDHREEALMMIRNDERPLCFAFEEGMKTLYWASEEWMLRVAVSRAGLKLEGGVVNNVEKDTLYRFPVPRKLSEKLSFTTEGGLVGKTPGFFQQTNDRGTGGLSGTEALKEAAKAARERKENLRSRLSSTTSNLQSGTLRLKPGEKQQTPNGTSSQNGSPASANITSIDQARTYKGYQGTPLSKKELELQLAGGCGWCENEFIDIRDRFAWLAPNKAVCAKCLDGEHEEEKKAVTIH